MQLCLHPCSSHIFQCSGKKSHFWCETCFFLPFKINQSLRSASYCAVYHTADRDAQTHLTLCFVLDHSESAALPSGTDGASVVPDVGACAGGLLSWTGLLGIPCKQQYNCQTFKQAKSIKVYGHSADCNSHAVLNVSREEQHRHISQLTATTKGRRVYSKTCLTVIIIINLVFSCYLESISTSYVFTH